MTGLSASQASAELSKMNRIPHLGLHRIASPDGFRYYRDEAWGREFAEWCYTLDRTVLYHLAAKQNLEVWAALNQGRSRRLPPADGGA